MSSESSDHSRRISASDSVCVMLPASTSDGSDGKSEESGGINEHEEAGIVTTVLELIGRTVSVGTCLFQFEGSVTITVVSLLLMKARIVLPLEMCLIDFEMLLEVEIGRDCLSGSDLESSKARLGSSMVTCSDGLRGGKSSPNFPEWPLVNMTNASVFSFTHMIGISHRGWWWMTFVFLSLFNRKMEYVPRDNIPQLSPLPLLHWDVEMRFLAASGR